MQVVMTDAFVKSFLNSERLNESIKIQIFR